MIYRVCTNRLFRQLFFFLSYLCPCTLRSFFSVFYCKHYYIFWYWRLSNILSIKTRYAEIFAHLNLVFSYLIDVLWSNKVNDWSTPIINQKDQLKVCLFGSWRLLQSLKTVICIDFELKLNLNSHIPGCLFYSVFFFPSCFSLCNCFKPL